METDQQIEREVLERYAKAMQKKIYTSRGDLSVADTPLVEMFEWCKAHPDVIVLKNLTILSSNPTARSVQNCKTVMLDKGFSPGKVMPATQELLNLLFEDIASSDEVADAGTVSEQQKQLRKLVTNALRQNVSDIHIEVREDISRIRFRKNGELYLFAEWLPKVAREVASVAFNKETDHATAHFNPMIPQDASMPLFLEGREVRLRLASVPAHGGFDMVMRVLTTGDDTAPSLDKLGYTEEQIAIIRRATNMPHGAIIVSGPTGSGKTTTLASCMKMISDKRKIYTIEDPVEKLISNATQVPVNTEKEDRDFAYMGRAALRMDPDDLVLGEMRDEDTAQVMVRAAITGHLIFSTLHTNSATAIVTRLVDMGISSVLLGDSNLLNCLISQRLAPMLCEECKKPLESVEKNPVLMSRWKQFFGEKIGEVFARGSDSSCSNCRGTGIAGRTVVAEVIWVDEIGRGFIQKSDTLGWVKYLKEQGWMNYKDHALSLVRQGILDPEDAERLIGEISHETSGDSSYKYHDK